MDQNKMELAQALSIVMDAKCAEDVFNNITEIKGLKDRYKELARALYPDYYKGKEKDSAEEGFKLLQSWLKNGEQKLENGIYGSRNQLVKPIVVSHKKASYVIIQHLGSDEICEIYLNEDGDKLLKIPRNVSSNIFLQNEIATLKLIKGGPKSDMVDYHIPDLLDSFEINDGGAHKRINVFPYSRGYIPLTEVTKQYPAGVDPRAAAWMFNRMIGAMGAVHDAGLIHGAFLPCNFLIRPEDHNGLLINFYYTRKIGEVLKNINTDFRHFYPPEVFDKLPLKTGLDIYMAAKCVMNLLAEDVKTVHTSDKCPKVILNLLQSCLLGYRYRQQNVFDLHAEFDEILKQLYGPKKFIPFELKA